jgi:hypothetical protein
MAGRKRLASVSRVSPLCAQTNEENPFCDELICKPQQFGKMLRVPRYICGFDSWKPDSYLAIFHRQFLSGSPSPKAGSLQGGTPNFYLLLADL